MKGIADGAAASGAKVFGRAVDLVDIAAANSEPETSCLDGALEATATGLEGKTFREPKSPRDKPEQAEHCSAFAATGPATDSGKIVFGHMTMFGLYNVRHFNVWLDLKPETGHRVLMQTYPGGIQSGMDYYQNDAGLLVTENTIGQTRFGENATPLASRIRKVAQYAGTIDEAVAILKAAGGRKLTPQGSTPPCQMMRDFWSIDSCLVVWEGNLHGRLSSSKTDASVAYDASSYPTSLSV